MKNVFVKTSNFEKFQEGLTAVEGRGAAESSLLLVTGEAGYGKSETVDQWAVQVGAAYLRAKTDWTPRYFLTELAEHLKVDPSGKSK
ncbi:MAG: ATP-binding protein, partial [Nitrosomonas sp. PRO4]|nr:ATP-binding protein [Nitrosomonas sp. PRO4]